MPIYDPKLVKVSFIGVPLTSGIADATFIKVSRDTPSATKKVGPDGMVVFTRNHDHSGKAELVVQAASDVNAYLTAMSAAWENGVGGIGAFFVSDLNGDANLCMAKKAVLEKPADFERATQSGDVTWTFLCDDIEIAHAGHGG